MAPAKGNKHGEVLSNPEIRQKAFESYCEHLASGMPKEAWWFEEGKYHCTHKSMENYYLKEYPKEFPSYKIQNALAQKYRHWLGKGKDCFEGKMKNAQPAVYQMIMRNLFGWDRPEKSENTKQPIEVHIHDGSSKSSNAD